MNLLPRNVKTDSSAYSENTNPADGGRLFEEKKRNTVIHPKISK